MKRVIRRIPMLMIAGVLAASGAQAEDLWLHVSVDEEEGAKVSVNLPLALVGKALGMVPDEHLRDGRVVLDGVEWSVPELRALWREVMDGPDMTFVTVEDRGENVRVWKQQGYLMVTVAERVDESTVDVRIPGAVVDALLSGEGDELDLAAALTALAAHGEGELVTVNDDRDRIRIWVDDQAEMR
jgi:hypothetical protein